MHTFNTIRKFVGRTANGDRIYVDAKLSEYSGESVTTDHQLLGMGQRFTMTAEIVAKHCREPHAVGQMLDDLLDIVKPAKGITLEDVKALHGAWKANHLNDMVALCDHQTAVYEYSRGYKSLDLETIGACPVSGYKPGSAWLYREPVEADMQRVHDILTKL